METACWLSIEIVQVTIPPLNLFRVWSVHKFKRRNGRLG